MTIPKHFRAQGHTRVPTEYFYFILFHFNGSPRDRRILSWQNVFGTTDDDNCTYVAACIFFSGPSFIEQE